VEHGADVNNTNKQNKTALLNACKNGNEAIVKYLVEHGVNKENWNRKSPLFYACKNGNKAMVKYLVEQGANVNKENRAKENTIILCM